MKPVIIRLTRHDNGKPVFINANEIQRFDEHLNGCSWITFSAGAGLIVNECPNALFQVINALAK
jgi:hypothetical protein